MAVKFGTNARGKNDKFRVLPVKTGDTVEVLAGKDKGKRGKILRTIPSQNRVVVEGVNMVRKAMRPTQANPQGGGISSTEAALNVSNVMLVCPSCEKATRVARRRDNGKKIRVCKKCGKDID